MRVAARVTVSAPPEAVWSIISDPERMLSFMSGVTRWEVAGDHPTGLGARYRMLFRVGSAEVGGLIEVVEFHAPRDMAWTSVTGLDQRGRWRLRTAGDGRTRVELRLAYGVAGAGLTGWMAERIAAPDRARAPAPEPAAAQAPGRARADARAGGGQARGARGLRTPARPTSARRAQAKALPMRPSAAHHPRMRRPSQRARVQRTGTVFELASTAPRLSSAWTAT